MKYLLAQCNVAKFRLPQDDPANADFVNSLDRVNAIAEDQAGFVWRLTGSGNDALDMQAFDDPNVLINMSVWSDITDLFDFVYKHKAHQDIMRRRAEWFDKIEFHMVLWWVEENEKPTVEEAKVRLELLQRNGPTAAAFTFKKAFDPPAA